MVGDNFKWFLVTLGAMGMSLGYFLLSAFQGVRAGLVCKYYSALADFILDPTE
jgi:hypothetical protein